MNIEETIVCVIDSGSFISLADCLSKKAKRTYYYSPFEQEYLDLHRCVLGDGLESFERLDEPLDPEVYDTIDLFVFPDIGYGGLQRFLRRQGKLVWGSMGASDLELFRTQFLTVLKEQGLPVVPSLRVKGLTKLADHLKEVDDKWIKINRYRENMETWHHQDWKHSQRMMEKLAVEFGPLKDELVFVVQDPVNGDDDSPVMEIGYDGWSVDGRFPSVSYQGYELKNELYLGSRLDVSEQPEEVTLVNEKMAPVLAEYGYRNFWATEIRVKDGVPNFIDPTTRMAGQTMEHLTNTCTNLPEVILAGAQGELLEPDFSDDIAAEATLHYTEHTDGDWKTLVVPKQIEPYVKLYHYCYCDGAYQFPPHKSDEVGVLCGTGDNIAAALEDLKEHFAKFGDEPVRIELSGFAELMKQIEDAQENGLKFTDTRLPDPTVVLDEE